MEKSGVYTIICRISGHVLVGESKNVHYRLTGHKNLLNKNKHTNPHLQNAWNLYGEENFEFEVLEYCELQFTKGLENYWCNLLNSHDRCKGYNILPTGPKGHQSHSLETKKKLSIASTGKPVSKETREKIGKANRGRIKCRESVERGASKHRGMKCKKETIEKIRRGNVGKKRSEETKRRISEANLGRKVSKETRRKLSEMRKGRIITQEHRDKISETNRKNETFKRRKVIQIDKDNNIIKEWTSLKEVERELGINNANLHKCCKHNEKKDLTKYQTLKGYIWKFVN